jgi:glycosyltransferase involved in cell wall biosynthesis
MADEAHPWSDQASRQGDVTILHYAVPSPMTGALASLPGARVLQYHNVTPARFFAPFDAGLARLCILGRRDLATLAGRVDLALGVSEYNRRELDALGFAHTDVLPLIVNTGRLTSAPRLPALERFLQDGLVNILFVGRIAPNKKIEDHIRLAEQYKRYVDIYYRFIFVGRDDAVPHYGNAVRALVAQYQMLPERFWFTGPVPDDDLAAFYRNAHAYVSLSEHEGFCAPLVEAMAMDVPVLAYAEAAVPETLGGAGVSFAPKDLEYAAELLGGLVYDLPFRERVLEGQRRRLADFRIDRIEAKLMQVLDAVA